MKFDCKALKKASEIYLPKEKLYTKLCKKETDRHHYRHIKSEHPKSLKNVYITVKPPESRE